MSIKGKTIDYSLHQEDSSVYKMMRVRLSNFPSSSVILDNTSQELQITLPANGKYNLARSGLGYTMPIPADPLAAKANWTHEDEFTLGSEISFGTPGDIKLADLKFAGNYTKIVRKMETSLAEMQTFDVENQLYPCNEEAALNFYGSTNARKGSTNYLETAYTSSTAAGTPTINNVYYPLNGFKNTIFSYDKTLYFGNEMVIKIQTNPLNKQIWRATSHILPETASAADDVPSVVVSNIFLYLAVEQNERINQSIVAKFNAGHFKINFPYTSAYSQSTTVAGINNISYSIIKASGKRLLQVLYTAFNSENTRNTAWDCNNSNGIKVLSYRTIFDDKHQSDYELSCLNPSATALNADDWYIANQKHCKGSAILNRDIYKLNWFHLDRFYEPNEKMDDDNLDIGKKLENHTMNYVVETVTQLAKLNHFIFATFRRTALLTKDGIEFESSN